MLYSVIKERLMAIYIKTENPQRLVDRIKECIDNHSIETWIYDSDGDFTHSVEQWKFRAWIRPYVESGRIVFGIICRNDKNLSVTEYAVYHGRFVEMLLRHFDKTCLAVEVTPLATNYDIINAKKE